MSREELQTLLESLATPTSTPITVPAVNAPATAVRQPATRPRHALPQETAKASVHHPTRAVTDVSAVDMPQGTEPGPQDDRCSTGPVATRRSHHLGASHPSMRGRARQFSSGSPVGPSNTGALGTAQEVRTGLTCDVRVLARPFGAGGVVPVSVRLAGPEDVDAVAWLNTRVWQETSSSVATNPEELEFETSRTAQQLAKALLGSKERTHGIDLYEHGGRLVVAEGDGELIGYAWCGPGRDPDPVRLVEVYSMQVAKAFHGTGVARAVLAMALEGHPAYLWVGRNNCRGQAFYAGLGFKTRDDNTPTRDLVCMFR